MEMIAEAQDRAGSIAARVDVLDRVRRLLIEQLHVRRRPDEIDPDCPLFATGLGLDSVDAVELIVGLENEFNLLLTDGPSTRRSLRTVNTLVTRILEEQGRLAASTTPAPAAAPSPVAVAKDARPLEVNAIRLGAAWSEMAHVVHLRIGGEGAYALIDRVVAADLVLRDGQLLQSLLLDDKGHVFADVQLARSDEDFLLFAEGPSPADLLAHLRAAAATTAPVTIEALDETYDAISLHGPYAWELMGDLLGPEVIGLPYGSLFRIDEWMGLRAGKTGEYGYDLLIPREHAAAARARLAQVGARFELRRVGLEALDDCALENGFFCVRREGRAGLLPTELQLQWRVSQRKDFVGAAALKQLRAHPATRRTTHVAGPGDSPLAVGDAIFDGEREVGRLLNVAACAPRGEQIGLAVVELAVAWPGMSGLVRIGADGQRSPLRTVGPPVIDNRSLFVSPQRHSWSTRADDELPPLVGG